MHATAEQLGPEDTPYTAEQLDEYVRRWDQLNWRAERMAGGWSTLGVGRGATRTDRLATADLIADVERAAASLPIGSLERHVIHARLASPGSLGQIARLLRTRKADVCEAYAAALAAMAAYLGGHR